MIGAGTVINPLIKILTTIAVLGAAYVFIVRPVLDTTNDVIDQTSQSVRDAAEQSQQAFHATDVQSARSRANSYADSLRSSWPAAGREVRACVHKGGDDLHALNQCVNFAQRLISPVNGDRSFSLSYADSLSAEGNQVAAARVRDCVKRAGFQSAAMHRCRSLADHLLFG